MENEVVKIIFCGLSFEIWHNEYVPHLDECRKESSIKGGVNNP
jgi:hypothetical protein